MQYSKHPKNGGFKISGSKCMLPLLPMSALGNSVVMYHAAADDDDMWQ